MLETKANKRKLRDLAGLAYKRQLGDALAKLEKEFARWRSGEIDPFELNHRIHRFHDGASRKLYNFYQNLPPYQAVASAIASHLLDRTEVPAEILAELEPIIRFFDERMGGPADEEDEDEDDPGTQRN